MRRSRLTGLLLAAVMMAACEGTTFQSSVPTYPVRITINTRMGPFVHFQPDNFGSHIEVLTNGYYVDGKFVMDRLTTDACGYGGIVAFVDLYGYSAYDLACPYCASRSARTTCEVDGIYATCPHCGERYDLGSGYALPQNGTSHEALRRMNIIQSDGKLTITQRQ